MMLEECQLCHNAAAGHDRIVPPDHDCDDYVGQVACPECDEWGYKSDDIYEDH